MKNIYPRKAHGPQFFCRFFEVHFLQGKKAYNKFYSVYQTIIKYNHWVSLMFYLKK